jgi:glycosyltransferase involved in cell wall biosynthesis
MTQKNAPPAGNLAPPITYIFRKSSPTIFSIEKLFNALYAHFESVGTGISRLELPRTSKGIIDVVRNVWYVARSRTTRILHITGDVHYAALLCPFAKTIITVHDCVVLQRGTGLKRLGMRLLWFSLPFCFAWKIVAISEQTKRELLETFAIAENKILVIPNFVDPAFAFRQRAFCKERPRILHVGITPNKNLTRVIAALRGVPCVLVIVGELSATIKRDLEQGGMRYENFVSVDHATMTHLYGGADIISFPSTYEGFGLPILEGQTVGRPILTSDLDPMRTVAGKDGALLVDPLSVDAIRDGFLRLIDDELLRARLVAAGRENAGRFTIQAVAALYMALYQSCRTSPGSGVTRRG